MAIGVRAQAIARQNVDAVDDDIDMECRRAGIDGGEQSEAHRQAEGHGVSTQQPQ
jgi:hypothetical protein